MGILRGGLLALGAVALTIGLGSCGKVADGGEGAFFDSNTNWLSHCLDDSECNGSLRCYCGMCTKPCGQDNECALLGGARCAQSGEDVCGEQASAGGLCVLECTVGSECGDDFNCIAGQCVPKPCVTVGALSWDEVFRDINDDLAQADAEDRLYRRYITLGNASGDGAQSGRCGVSNDVKRDALSKLLNALSIDGQSNAPAWLDAGQRLLQIDLRNLDWDRQMLVGDAYPDKWEALVNQDPYALAFTGDDADDAVADTGTSMPVMLADSFIAITTQPNVYYGLLGIPEQLDQYLVDELGIDPTKPLVKAGFTVAGKEFLAQYWPTQARDGFVWEIAEFGREPGALLQNPLAEPLGQREVIFTLPNGVNAFAFMSSDGRRLDNWKTTYDDAERDNVARAPRSNWRRHPREVAVQDEVFDYVAANPDRYTDADLAEINRLFIGPDRLERLLARDYSTYQSAALLRAISSAGIHNDDPEPVTTSYAEYEQRVTLAIAAAELLVTPSDLRSNLALLNPALQSLNGGSIDRELFTSLFHDSACILGTVLTNQPADCP
jgi:hypothetical protein